MGNEKKRKRKKRKEKKKEREKKEKRKKKEKPGFVRGPRQRGQRLLFEGSPIESFPGEEKKIIIII